MKFQGGEDLKMSDKRTQGNVLGAHVGGGKKKILTREKSEKARHPRLHK